MIYSYGNSLWGDLLTAYNGKPITYDGSGNPLTYDGWTYTWQGGRQLAAMSNGTTNLSFEYNESGLRTQKTVNGTTHYYTYMGNLLVADVTANDALYFHYDSAGDVLGFTYASGGTESTYFYLKNRQGDIVRVLNYEGKLAASYTYDAWGNILSISGPDTNIANRNPLRYKGYYYDTETGYYYLQSRYYDPEIGRFINADSYAMTYETPVGANMFAYCMNNPISMADDGGEAAHIAIGAALGAAFGALDAYMSGENVIVGALAGGAIGAISAAILTAIGGSVAAKATTKATKFVAKSALPMVHASVVALGDVTTQIVQSMLNHKSFSWDAKSTLEAAAFGFSGAITANRIN